MALVGDDDAYQRGMASAHLVDRRFRQDIGVLAAQTSTGTRFKASNCGHSAGSGSNRTESALASFWS